MNWDRIVAPIGTVLVPVGLVLAVYGQGLPALAVLVLFAGVLLVFRRRGRRRQGDLDWGVSTGAASPAAEPARGSVAVALAPVEIRELLLSPLFAAGAGFCVLFGSIAVDGFERSWWLSAGLLPLMIHPFCGLTIVATHRNVTRAQRDRAEELFATCPGDITNRTSGHLLTAVVPVVVGAVFVLGTLVGAAVVLDNIYGPIDDRVVGDVFMAAVLLPAGAVALGVLLGRRAKFALAPYIALAVIAILNIEMTGRGLDGRGWLSTGIPSISADIIYFEPPVVGRLLWVAGLGIIVGSLALATRGRSATTLAVSTGLVIAVVGLVVTVRPLSDATVDRLTEYVIAPDAHEICQTLTPDVEVCALRPYRDHGANLAEHLQPVADAIPITLSTPIKARLLAGDAIDQLPSQVQQQLVPTPYPPGSVEMPFGHLDGSFDAARFVLGAAAVGIPTGSEAPQNVLVDGQARGVAALWLALSGLDREAALDLLEPDEYGENSASGRADIWPATCGADIQWAPQDLVAARSMVGIDRDRVDGVLASDWPRWTSPDTTTDELMTALALPLVGPPDHIEPLGSGSC